MAARPSGAAAGAGTHYQGKTMADKIVGREVNPNPNSGVPIRLKDMGDGTFAEVISTSGGGGGGGGAVTVAAGAVAAGAYVAGSLVDGADATQGLTTDAAVAAGAAGTESAKLRAISRDVGTIASGTPTVGQKAMSGSVPVAIASDQGAITVTGSVSTTAPTDIFVNATNVTAQNTVPVGPGAATANSTVSVTLTGGQNVVTANISANALGAAITVQVTTDGSNWVSYAQYATLSTSPQANYSSSIASGTTGQFQWYGLAGCKGFRLSANTATVSGTLTATLNASIGAAPMVTTVALQQVGTALLSTMNQAGGSAGAAVGVFQASATTATDYSAGAWAAASGSGATISDQAGAVCSFDVNLSTFTAGSSTGLDIFLDSSKDGGTTWDTHWQCEALTAAGHASIPALLIPGARRRMRWVNRGGAATTATVTATANRMSVSPAKPQRQFYDRTSTLIGVSAGAVSVGATTTGWINGTATAGAGYDTGGASSIAATIPVLSAATTAPTYQLQVCPFNSTNSNDWAGVGTAVLASTTTATRLTATGITERFFRVICTVAGSGVTGSYIALTAS